MTIAAGTKLGRYEIRSMLGEGGMGEVYLAHDTQLDRKVALKILSADLASNQERMRRFVQEAKGSPPRPLTDLKSERIFSFDWSLDGKWLALSRGPEQRDVVLMSNFR